VQSFRIDIDDEGANFRAIVILFVDVTATEQARMLAKRESQRNRSLTELSRAAIERIDEDAWRALLTTESGRALPGMVVAFDDHSTEDPKPANSNEGLVVHRVPVSNGTTVVGDITLQSDHEPLEEDLRFLEAIAAIASIRIQTTAYERELERLSHVDRQFEIWNRRCFLEHIDDWNLGVEQPPPALLLVRITNARDLHDQIGIETTNHAIRAWLDRIREYVPSGSELFALSSDEFAITPPTGWAASEAGLEELLHRLSDASSILVHDQGIGMMLRTKMAGLLIDRDEPLGYQSLYGTLDLAIRRIGRHGDWSSQPVRQRADALARQEALEIMTRYYYGPKSDTIFEPAIDLDSMRPILYEAKTPLRALAGLSHEHGSPVDALISSGLVTLAEETELYLALGYIATLRAPVSLVTVNASPRSLLNGTLRMICREVERPSGVQVGFELSERLLVDIPVTRLADEVAALGEIGGKVILDEVGRGFSSFVLLRDVSFHAIKLSRSLYGSIEEPGGALTGVLVDLARDLGIDAIATGVYTPELSERLVELGASVQQGLAVTTAYQRAVD
jgi:EAL domain-containing protein (putative c-di-GMP-specific phosphodiesterase class I)